MKMGMATMAMMQILSAKLQVMDNRMVNMEIPMLDMMNILIGRLKGMDDLMKTWECQRRP